MGRGVKGAAGTLRAGGKVRRGRQVCLSPVLFHFDDNFLPTMTLITSLYSRKIKLIVDSDNIFKGGNSMASSSIFIYELRSPSEINVESI